MKFNLFKAHLVVCVQCIRVGLNIITGKLGAMLKKSQLLALSLLLCLVSIVTGFLVPAPVRGIKPGKWKALMTHEVMYSEWYRWTFSVCEVDAAGLLQATSSNTQGPSEDGPDWNEILQDLLLLADRALDTVEVRTVDLSIRENNI